MGTVELAGTRCIIRSHIITYGNAADPLITEQIRAEIEDMWNAPTAVFNKSGNALRVLFEITWIKLLMLSSGFTVEKFVSISSAPASSPRRRSSSRD